MFNLIPYDYLNRVFLIIKVLNPIWIKQLDGNYKKI